jgi:hypothetical protein
MLFPRYCAEKVALAGQQKCSKSPLTPLFKGGMGGFTGAMKFHYYQHVGNSLALSA